MVELKRWSSRLTILIAATQYPNPPPPFVHRQISYTELKTANVRGGSTTDSRNLPLSHPLSGAAWTLNGPYTVRRTNPDHREIGKVDDKCGKVLGTYLAHRRDEHMLFRTQPSTGFVYPAQSCAEVFVVTIAHAEPS